MTRTHLLLVVALATGLSGCGQNAETGEQATASDVPPEAEASVLAAQPTAAAAGGAPAKPEAASVAALPLKRGFYVASDTPCGKASNATLTLLRREGIGGARDFCEFKTIEQTGPSTYRVTQACGDLQDGTQPQVSVITFTLSGDTGFTSKSEDGWERSARYCSQSSLPEPWRDNDISDVTG